MSLCCACVFSGRCLCVGQITNTGAYRVCGVSECDREAQITRTSSPRGCCAIGEGDDFVDPPVVIRVERYAGSRQSGHKQIIEFE
jgi:hypothetical protein